MNNKHAIKQVGEKGMTWFLKFDKSVMGFLPNDYYYNLVLSQNGGDAQDIVAGLGDAVGYLSSTWVRNCPDEFGLF